MKNPAGWNVLPFEHALKKQKGLMREHRRPGAKMADTAGVGKSQVYATVWSDVAQERFRKRTQVG